MITTHIDLGQLVLGALITIVAWFIKKEINGFAKRLDLHDATISTLMGTVNNISGQVGVLVKLNDGLGFLHRRATDKREERE